MLAIKEQSQFFDMDFVEILKSYFLSYILKQNRMKIVLFIVKKRIFGPKK